jgi:hypothetical protein
MKVSCLIPVALGIAIGSIGCGNAADAAPRLPAPKIDKAKLTAKPGETVQDFKRRWRSFH